MVPVGDKLPCLLKKLWTKRDIKSNETLSPGNKITCLDKAVASELFTLNECFTKHSMLKIIIRLIKGATVSLVAMVSPF